MWDNPRILADLRIPILDMTGKPVARTFERTSLRRSRTSGELVQVKAIVRNPNRSRLEKDWIRRARSSLEACESSCLLHCLLVTQLVPLSCL